MSDQSLGENSQGWTLKTPEITETLKSMGLWKICFQLKWIKCRQRCSCLWAVDPVAWKGSAYFPSGGRVNYTI